MAAAAANRCMYCNNVDCRVFVELFSDFIRDGVVCFFIEVINTHPPLNECTQDECLYCSIRDCPQREWMHYHHDGCPACDS